MVDFAVRTSMRDLAAFVIAVVACTPTEPPPRERAQPMPAPAPAPRQPPAEGPAPARNPDDPWSCTRDDECMASCRHGAVARAWHFAAYPGEEACQDGCTSKGTDSPRCEDGSCVAYRGGTRDPTCTRVDQPPIPGPGPAHRCTRAEDCTTLCSLGAVNASWLATSGRREGCKGGCTAVGVESPRCEDGRCVAYRRGGRLDGCTQRSVREGE